ncbi:unnamed protein product [Acanthocheilonema viteae]|uniref:Uncharacterized protein n=1 Tax=Acanthocheilonema viteae TaxID=6277 RepID=A0A498SYN5_ACAVI|nr:unnamed protein product [Acanthocheilonema viteae]
MMKLQRVQKQFFPKPRTPESTVQSSASLRDEKIDENERKNYGSATTLTNSVSEQSLGLESKSSDFPTVIPSKFRNDAGQDNNVNSISIVQKQRIGWDDIEMMRHGLINCCCVRAIPPESTTLPTTINIGNTYSHKMTNSKQIDHISAISESVQNVHPVYTQDFHKSV